MAARAKTIIAIVVGTLIAGVPMGTLNYWLDAFVERQGKTRLKARRAAPSHSWIIASAAYSPRLTI